MKNYQQSHRVKQTRNKKANLKSCMEQKAKFAKLGESRQAHDYSKIARLAAISRKIEWYAVFTCDFI